MTRLLKTLRLPLVLTLALVPALVVAAPTKTKKKKSGSAATGPVKTGVFAAELRSVETLADGQIKLVGTHAPYGNQMFKGCGARLADHPHLMLAFQPGFVVTIEAENHCIKTIHVARAG